MHAIETDALGIEHGTFRGAWEPAWLGDTDPMAWQRSGELARGLRAHGVRSVVVGEVSEEWYLYSIAHPVKSVEDVHRNLERYYKREVVERMCDETAEGRDLWVEMVWDLGRGKRDVDVEGVMVGVGVDVGMEEILAEALL